MKQDEARIERIYALFDEYRQAYAAEWQRLERCERLYMGEHWHDVPQSDTREPRPVTPVLQSTIENIRADLMDQMPVCLSYSLSQHSIISMRSSFPRPKCASL